MNGIICLDKPQGITSFSACAAVKRLAGVKRCGHMGTLDPLATGVLPVMLGGATRFLEYFPETDKGYTARFRLGLTTDTLDITGAVTSQSRVNVSAKEVEDALGAFRGSVTQQAPMYSAVSVGGKRLYELARRGEEAERPVRCVEIKKLLLTGADEKNNEYQIDVLCSKGTYIRTLTDDLGKALGCGAVMTSLRRTYACGFSLDDCFTLEELGAAAESGGVEKLVIPLSRALSAYKSVTVTAAQSVRFKNGGALSAERVRSLPKSGILRVFSPNGDFLGLGEVRGDELAVRRVFVE